MRGCTDLLSLSKSTELEAALYRATSVIHCPGTMVPLSEATEHDTWSSREEDASPMANTTRDDAPSRDKYTKSLPSGQEPK